MFKARYGGLGMVLIALQGCGPNVATQCYQVQDVLIQAQPSMMGTTQVAQIEEAEGYVALAETLAALETQDDTLAAHQSALVMHYRQLGELIQTQAAWMEADGTVIIDSAAKDADYTQLSQQLRGAYDAVETEQNALRLYCSLQ